MSATSDFYLTQADKCAAEAAASPLVQVRDRNLRAETAWRAMAERLILAETSRAKQVAAAAIVAAAQAAANTAASTAANAAANDADDDDDDDSDDEDNRMSHISMA